MTEQKQSPLAPGAQRTSAPVVKLADIDPLFVPGGTRSRLPRGEEGTPAKVVALPVPSAKPEIVNVYGDFTDVVINVRGTRFDNALLKRETPYAGTAKSDDFIDIPSKNKICRLWKGVVEKPLTWEGSSNWHVGPGGRITINDDSFEITNPNYVHS